MPDTMLGPADPGHCWTCTVQRPERHNFRCKPADGGPGSVMAPEAGAYWGPSGLTPQAGREQDTLPWVGPCHGAVTEAGLVGQQHPCLALSEHVS